MVRLHLVHLVQALQPDAIELADVMHALVVLHDVDGVVLEFLGGALALLLQVDDVTCCGRVVTRKVVEGVQVLETHARLLTDECHVVARLHHDEVVLVVTIDDMVDIEGVLVHHALLVAQHHVFARVKLAQVVHLDDAYERLGIGGAGCIARSLQSVCPSLVIGDVQSEEPLITSALQEDGVVHETLVCAAVFAEFLIRCVVRAQYIRACP